MTAPIVHTDDRQPYVFDVTHAGLMADADREFVRRNRPAGQLWERAGGTDRPFSAGDIRLIGWFVPGSSEPDYVAAHR